MRALEIAEKYNVLVYRKNKSPHLSLRFNGVDFHIDTIPNEGFNLITHAHSDHYGQRNLENRSAIASFETAKILEVVTGKRFSGKKIEVGDKFKINGVKIETYPTGHMHGSTAFYLKDAEVLITGDVKNWRNLPECRILITEATYGSPSYIFEDEIDKLLRVAREKVFLGAYPIGKAQRVAEILYKEGYDFTAEEKIRKICEALEIDVGDRGACIVSPKNLKEGYILTAQKFYRHPRIVISDHVDYRGLISMIEHCNAEHVIFYHGGPSRSLIKDLACRKVSCSTIEDIDIFL